MYTTSPLVSPWLTFRRRLASLTENLLWQRISQPQEVICRGIPIHRKILVCNHAGELNRPWDILYLWSKLLTSSCICILARYLGHCSRQSLSAVLPSIPEVWSKQDLAITPLTGGYGISRGGAKPSHTLLTKKQKNPSKT